MNKEISSQMQSLHSAVKSNQAGFFLSIRMEVDNGTMLDTGSIDPVVVEGSSNTVVEPAEAQVLETVVPVVPPAKDHGYELYKSVRRNCVAAEKMALDFLNTEIHHPAISCMREITKHDFNVIFSSAQFKNEIDKFDQCFICIGLIDYIATSIKNPLYYENFCKIQTKVQVCVKKVFLELRRALRDWASSDFCEFVKTKDLIINYLRGLTSFFKIINYDVSFSSALHLLAKDTIRYQKQYLKAKRTASRTSIPEERLALVEIATNVSDGPAPVKDDDDEDLGEKDQDTSDDMFDVLDDKTSNEKTPTALIFKRLSNKSPKIYPSKTPRTIMSFIKNPSNCAATKPKSQNQDTENDRSSMMNKDPVRTSMGVKRQSVEELESQAKRSCTDVPLNSSSISVNSPVKTSSPEVSIISCSPKLSAPDSSASPVERQVVKNAFVFLMNRQKEIFKADKLKKVTGKTNAKVKGK